MWPFQQHTGSPSQPANEHARPPPNPTWVSQTKFWDLRTDPEWETWIWQKKRYLCAQRWSPLLWMTVSIRQTASWVHHHSMVSMVHPTQRCINITQEPQHPLHSIFTLMPPGRRFESQQAPLHQTIGQLCAPGCQRDEWFPSPHCEDITLSASPYTNELYLNSLCTAIISYTIIVLGHQHHTYSHTVYSLISCDFKMEDYFESVCLNTKKFYYKIPWVLDRTILSKYFGPFCSLITSEVQHHFVRIYLSCLYDCGSNYY